MDDGKVSTTLQCLVFKQSQSLILLLFSVIFKYGRKNILSTGNFFHVYLSIENVRVQQNDDSEFEFLITKLLPIAVECDSNSKVLKHVRNLDFLKRKTCLF